MLKDPNYIPIGDSSLINIRKSRIITGNLKLSDFVSFYFCAKAPMLYMIRHGFKDVQQREPEEIVYLVSSIEKIVDEDYLYYFTDGKANASVSKVFDSIKDLDKLDWDVIEDEFWANTEEDQDRKRRKQAEFLIYQTIKLQDIIGIAVYNKSALEKVDKLKEIYSLENLVAKIRKNYYY